MYRQINVTDSDSDLQRILWREHPEDEICEFRLKTLTYGTASAPYLATKTLQQLAKDEADEFPLASRITCRDFYVDDLISGVSDVAEAFKLQAELMTMMQRGGFQLRKWTSNRPELVNSVPEDYREVTSPVDLNRHGPIKALGLRWEPSGDYFFFVANFPQQMTRVTKRSVMSEIARLYDPLGWLAPIVIFAKILIQRLWTIGLPWDEELPMLLKLEWINYRTALNYIQNYRVVRGICTEIDGSYQLHGFSDASEQAFGAVIYLRESSAAGYVQVRLVCAKTRVAPLKQISLPRLELCAALLLARLLDQIKKTLNLKIDSVHAWTDSTVVLSWIKGFPRSWKTFVANRVSEIQELVPPGNWKHVPSKENPADPASRGLQPNELMDCSLWWNGPQWLHHTGEAWPKGNQQTNQDHDDSLPERRVVGTLVATASVQSCWDSIIERFSSLSKLTRVTAYCLRFIQNAKLPKEQRVFGALTSQEIARALIVCVKSVQALVFSKTIDDLLKREDSKSSPIASLSPFLDENNVLRVGGRLRQANLQYEQRFPMLLPKKHHLTELVIWDAHVRQLHAGPQATLAILRQTFWIVNGRSIVRSVLFKCHRCFRDRVKPLQQQMGDLPRHRVEQVRPFFRCGVDYGGPFQVKSKIGRGAKTSKAYMCLFVCFTTKAIHIEVVSDLTSEAFIAALKRFMARRGVCGEIYSDNGTNFIGANHELGELLRQFNSEQHNERVTTFLS